jgi:ubiquinone/menaquinone biosynthesis C-methylase UbiE
MEKGDNRFHPLKNMVCPWWLGYTLLGPIRRLLHNPENILRPYVKEGMTALDVGCGMGFFSLPLAEMVGPAGRVVCVDLQERMIRSLEKRAQKAGLSGNIETRVCGRNSLGVDDLEGSVDFAIAFAMVHEVPDRGRMSDELGKSMKRGGLLLVAEPKGHVSQQAFNETASDLMRNGFEAVAYPAVRMSRATLFRKKP